MVNRSYTIYDGPDIIEQGMHDVTWEEVRRQRNQLLDASDWRAMKDRTLPNEWRDYRQALRDITEHPDANTAVDHWPRRPLAGDAR